MELGRRKSLDDHHGPTTLRTAPKRVRFPGKGGFWFGLRWLHGAENLKAKRQEGSPPAVGEEAEVADADEALGEQVQQEAAEELIER